MRTFLVVTLVAASGILFASADPKEDAQAIVEATVTEDLMAATFSAMSELVVHTLQNEANKAGKPLSDDAARVIGNMMVSRMVPYIVADMRAEMATAYLYSMSPEGLAGLRAFLETPSGIEWANAQADLVGESTKVGEKIAAPVATKAVSELVADIKSDKWPDGVLASTKAELREFFAD